MNIHLHIKRNGLRGRAVLKALRLDIHDHKAAVEYCHAIGRKNKTLPARIKEEIPDVGEFGQVTVAMNGSPATTFTTLEIYFMAFPMKKIEYNGAKPKRQLAIAQSAQRWTSRRIHPSCAILPSHNPKSKHPRCPRLLRFNTHGGRVESHFKGRAKLWNADSVVAQLKAEGIPRPL